MNEYEELVSEAFRLRSTLPFSNGDAKDARIVIKHLFLNSNKEVIIYSDCLTPYVMIGDSNVPMYDWVELQYAAESFLQKDKNTRLRIKVSDEKSACEKSKFLGLVDKYPEQVSIAWGIGRKGSNFTINDRGGFRLERGNEHRAVACANDVEFSSALRTVFDDKLISKSA